MKHVEVNTVGDGLTFTLRSDPGRPFLERDIEAIGARHLARCRAEFERRSRLKTKLTLLQIAAIVVVWAINVIALRSAAFYLGGCGASIALCWWGMARVDRPPVEEFIRESRREAELEAAFLNHPEGRA